MKNRPTESIHLSDPAQSEAEHRRAERNLQLLLDHTEEVFLFVDRDLRISHINTASLKKISSRLGVSVYVGMEVLQLATEAERPFIREIYRKVFGGETTRTEYRTGSMDDIQYYITTYKPVTDEQDGVIGALVTAVNITAQKKVEEELKRSEQLWRFALEGSNQGVWDWHIPSGRVHYNSIWKSMLGLTDADVEENINDWTSRVHEDDLQKALADVRRHFSGETPHYENIHRMRRSDGQYLWILDRGMVTEWGEDGKPKRMVGTHTDVSDKKRAEEDFRRLFQLNPLPSYIYDLETLKVMEVNDAAIATYGYTREEFSGLCLKLLMPEENHQKFSRLLEENAGQGKLHITRWPHIRKDGTRIFCNIHSSLTEYNGRPARHTMVEDITDKVAREEALQRSDELYTYVSKATSDAIYDWDLRTNHLQWGEGFKKLFGFEPSEITIDVWESLLHPDDSTEIKESLAAALLPGNLTIWEASYRLRTQFGNYRHVVEKGYILRDEEGTALRMIGALQDITALKDREAHLQKSIERNHFVSQATSDIIWDWNLETGDILWSDKYTEVLGWELPAGKSQPVQYCINRMHPDEQEAVSSRLQAAIADPRQHHWRDQFRYQRKDGTFAYVSDRGHIVRNAEGKGIRVIGAMQDVTKQRMSTELMRLERTVFELSSNPSVPFPVVVNALLQGLEAIYPHFVTSVLQLQDHGIVSHLAAPSLPAGFRAALHGQVLGPGAGSCGAAMHQRRTVIVADTSLDPLWQDYREFAQTYSIRASWSFPIIHSSGRVLGSMAVYSATPRRPDPEELQMLERHRNILRILMEHQASLEEIRTANKRFDLMSQATHDIIWDWDLQTNLIYRNEEGVQSVYGLASNEPISTIYQWLMHIHPEDHARVQNLINEFLQGNERETFEVEYRFLREDGQYACVYDRGKIVRNSEGRPVRMIGAAQDITERKRLEQQLLHQELDRQKAINQATIDTQEGERAEIGRELHDNVNQVLTTTKLYLDLALANADMKDELIHKSLRNIIGVINEIRQLSRSLMDPSLGDLGLIDSIHDLVDNINLTRRLHVTLEAPEGLEEGLDAAGKLTLFRIIQEALNNAIRHARATSVLLRFSREEGAVRLFIEDDGIGFHPQAIKKGAGLKNIENRIYLMNGSYTIDSEPDKGCRILINFPL